MIPMTTIQARKQRKALANAPWHRRRRLLSARLDESYLEDPKRKLPHALPVRKGDIVKIMRGDEAGKEGKVASVDYQRLRITIEGITSQKAKGQQVAKQVHPSKVKIVKLDETDPMRLRRYEEGSP